MDVVWSITILANCFLLVLLLRESHYLCFFFLTVLVGFNVSTVPAILCVYYYFSSYYPALYHALPWMRCILWFSVCFECHFIGQKKISFPIEIYALITAIAWIADHVGFVYCAYWINQGMRLFNLAVILAWIMMFYPRKEPSYYV